MSTGIGRWLRQQREARGWARREMARRLIQAAEACDDTTVPGIEHLETYVRRWESGRHGPTERYVLYFCTAFGIRPGQFGTAPLPRPRTLAQQAAASAPSEPPGAGSLPGVVPLLDLASRCVPAGCGEMDEPQTDYPAVGRRVVLAAHYASSQVEQAEQHRIGEVTYDQLHADVARLARASDTGDPAVVVEDMDRIRERVCRLLGRRLQPPERASLYVLLDCGPLAAELGLQRPVTDRIRVRPPGTDHSHPRLAGSRSHHSSLSGYPPRTARPWGRTWVAREEGPRVARHRKSCGPSAGSDQDLAAAATPESARPAGLAASALRRCRGRSPSAW
ncbi:MAG: helix-turn-helix transcriptional regulator [Streptosporangiaceae bacterium]|nr:helix-turn-helix transcriptional regulator [Streptosporangiaceae bacterium]